MNHALPKRSGTVNGIDRMFFDSQPSTTSSASMTTFVVPPVVRRAGAAVAAKKAIENAVYGHIRAVRALGRKEIFPSEIAEALGLSVALVMRALEALQTKGVKFGK